MSEIEAAKKALRDKLMTMPTDVLTRTILVAGIEALATITGTLERVAEAQERQARVAEDRL